MGSTSGVFRLLSSRPACRQGPDPPAEQRLQLAHEPIAAQRPARVGPQPNPGRFLLRHPLGQFPPPCFRDPRGQPFVCALAPVAAAFEFFLDRVRGRQRERGRCPGCARTARRTCLAHLSAAACQGRIPAGDRHFARRSIFFSWAFGSARVTGHKSQPLRPGFAGDSFLPHPRLYAYTLLRAALRLRRSGVGE